MIADQLNAMILEEGLGTKDYIAGIAASFQEFLREWRALVWQVRLIIDQRYAFLAPTLAQLSR